MEFERYKPEKHGEKLNEWFRYKASEPDNLEKYEEIVEEAYDDFRNYFGLERQVRLVFAKTNIEVLKEKYDEIPVWEYAMGFSTDPEYHEVERPTVFIMATDDYEHWENILKFTLAHEIAHQKFYELRDVGWRIYQRMLFEGHAMHSAEELSKEKNYDWSHEGWSPEKVNPEAIKQELEKFNKWKDQEDVDVSSLFVPGGDKWANAEGYPITYKVTERLIDKMDLDVQDLLTLPEEEWKVNVKEILTELYG